MQRSERPYDAAKETKATKQNAETICSERERTASTKERERAAKRATEEVRPGRVGLSKQTTTRKPRRRVRADADDSQGAPEREGIWGQGQGLGAQY